MTGPQRVGRVAPRMRRYEPRRRILAIDPGPERSAWLMFTGGLPEDFRIDSNFDLVVYLRANPALFDVAVIEEIESFGMAVGREVFRTVWWAGRFAEAVMVAGRPVVQLPRRDVKMALCHDSRAKDTNIRAALIDRFGGTAAVGLKAKPGPLYGISKDVWSALAIAVTYADGEGQ